MNILAFGEILWDIFPMKKVIGGASFNFSAHLAKLGADVSLITSVGKDELGQEAKKHIVNQGVKDDFVEISEFPTGVCHVTIDTQGIPSYDLLHDVSYDYIKISGSESEKLKNTSFDAFYFGTLAARNSVSKATLLEILKNGSFKNILFDINIRQNYYTSKLIKQGLSFATILKVSREECFIFEKIGILSINRSQFENEVSYYCEVCQQIARQFKIKTILFTLDKDGAIVYDSEKNAFYFSEKPKGKVVSTVGAGDSFSAGYLYFCLKGEPVVSCLNKAIILSDYVVQHLEAIPEYSDTLKSKLNTIDN